MKSCAIFDVDGTVIRDTTLIELYKYYLQITNDDAVASFNLAVKNAFASGTPRIELNRWFYETYFKDMEISRLSNICRSWYELRIKDPEFFYSPIIDAIKHHQDRGIDIVLATGSFREVVRPIAENLGVKYIISAPLEEVGGRYTGKLTDLPTIDRGKKHAVAKFLSQHNVRASRCLGYSDHDSDLPFLNSIGFPVVVKWASDALYNHAIENQWQVLG